MNALRVKACISKYMFQELDPQENVLNMEGPCAYQYPGEQVPYNY
jgi:hypothetical protein